MATARWEYKVLDLSFKSSADIQAALNALGVHGWELVSTVHQTFYFKRRQEQQGADHG